MDELPALECWPAGRFVIIMGNLLEGMIKIYTREPASGFIFLSAGVPRSPPGKSGGQFNFLRGSLNWL